MGPSSPGWLLVALTACGLVATAALAGYFEWRIRSLTRVLRGWVAAPGGGVDPAAAADRMSRASAQLDEALRRAQQPYRECNDAAVDDARLRLGRELAGSGATAEAIAGACGLNLCDAELLRAVRGALPQCDRPAPSTNAAPVPAAADHGGAHPPAQPAPAGSRRRRKRRVAAEVHAPRP